MVKEDEIPEGDRIYGLGLHCNDENTRHDKIMMRMHDNWEQALLRRLGVDKNVNGHRILLLYTDHDTECVYPAERFPERHWFDGYRKKKKDIRDRVKASPSELLIERNVPYLYEQDSEKRYTNYWMLLKDG